MKHKLSCTSYVPQHRGVFMSIDPLAEANTAPVVTRFVRSGMSITKLTSGSDTEDEKLPILEVSANERAEMAQLGIALGIDPRYDPEQYAERARFLAHFIPSRLFEALTRFEAHGSVS